MLQIMLCGAHDASDISDAFSEVTRDFGGEPWHYADGTIRHINSVTSSWVHNSRATVRDADLCVFVIVEQWGDITWNHELDEALAGGKPFVVMALEKTWTRVMNLRHGVSDLTAVKSEGDRQLLELFRKISSDYQLTVVSFTYMTFKERLRGLLSALMLEGLHLTEARNRREAFIALLHSDTGLRPHQVAEAVELACDEYELNKLARKTALRRLADGGYRDGELVLSVCRSMEQGVQRLGFELLPQLLPEGDSDLLDELAGAADRSDDLGVRRRFIVSAGTIAPTRIDELLPLVTATDVSLRRLAYEAVDAQWDQVMDAWGRDRMAQFLVVCAGGAAATAGWVERLKRRQSDLEEN